MLTWSAPSDKSGEKGKNTPNKSSERFEVVPLWLIDQSLLQYYEREQTSIRM